MRVPSRRLPSSCERAVHPAVRWGCGLLAAAAVLDVARWFHGLAVTIFLAVVVTLGRLVVLAERRRMRRFAATRPEARPGEALCRFAGISIAARWIRG